MTETQKKKKFNVTEEYFKILVCQRKFLEEAIFFIFLTCFDYILLVCVIIVIICFNCQIIKEKKFKLSILSTKMILFKFFKFINVFSFQ